MNNKKLIIAGLLVSIGFTLHGMQEFFQNTNNKLLVAKYLKERCVDEKIQRSIF